MRRKRFLTLAVFATVVTGMQTTEAQREQRQRQGGDQRQRGGQGCGSSNHLHRRFMGRTYFLHQSRRSNFDQGPPRFPKGDDNYS